MENKNKIRQKRINEIYEITKKEISDGHMDIREYVQIMYYLINLDEDYEAAEGIRLAIADYGLQLIIPENENELDELNLFY